MTRKLVLTAAAVVVLLSVLAVDLSAQTPQLQVKHLGPCRDQWINYAYMERLHRNPIGAKNRSASHASADFGECNCNLYAGCAWNSYAQLEQGVVAWDAYTRDARAVVRQVGGLFQVLQNNRAMKVVVRNRSGNLFDFMGNVLRGYSLMSENAKDLGNGTKVELK